LDSGHICGAALDVYPGEPGSNGQFNDCPEIKMMASCKNVILTPHIGGSTEEAQRGIGQEVALAMVRYLHLGTSTGAVSFPELDIRAPLKKDQCRILNVHRNIPGVLVKLNNILSRYNIARQTSDSALDIAYVITDLDCADGWSDEVAVELLERIPREIPASITTRILRKY
jgi:D-3-phosphoglycerate dehydrogenase